MSSENTQLEDIVYREAGHSVMAFLLFQGFTAEYVPLDRSLILPPFEQVSIEEPFKDWRQLTGSLGSLITVPQVLIAGYLAPQIHHHESNIEVDLKHPLLSSAEHLLSAYIEEYNDDLSYNERHEHAQQLLLRMVEHVHDQLDDCWASVDALAETLSERKKLPEAGAFEIIERHIPQSKRDQVQAILEQEKKRQENVRKQVLRAIEKAQRKKKQ